MLYLNWRNARKKMRKEVWRRTMMTLHKGLLRLRFRRWVHSSTSSSGHFRRHWKQRYKQWMPVPTLISQSKTAKVERKLRLLLIWMMMIYLSFLFCPIWRAESMLWGLQSGFHRFYKALDYFIVKPVTKNTPKVILLLGKAWLKV